MKKRNTVRRSHFWVVKPCFSHLSLKPWQTWNISFKVLKILAIYIENSVNMCSGMSVFAGRRRGGFANSSVNFVIGFLLAIIAGENDDVLWLSDWRSSWLFKIICIIFWSVGNVFIFSKPDVSRRINRSNFCCRRCDSESEDCLLNASEDRSFDLTTTNSVYLIQFDSDFCSDSSNLDKRFLKTIVKFVKVFKICWSELISRLEIRTFIYLNIIVFIAI